MIAADSKNIIGKKVVNKYIMFFKIIIIDTDCRSNLYAGSPSYLLILFSALSAFAVGGLSIERNQKPLAPEITLAATHHDRQKQVEVKRSSRVNPHEIRLFSGCPYAVVK